jgi:hypothetical protein
VRGARRGRLLVASAALCACARALPPPGGETDRSPPRIVETWPAEREVITTLDEPVVFRFDERISERGVRESILVSPDGDNVEVEKGRSEIRVTMPGGWKPDRVYRVVLLPVVRDLFGNERREPATLVFSTGPPVPNTAVGGVVLDRLTGRPATRVAVQALGVPDSITYNTVGDSAAFFALANLPVGQYVVVGWIDQNGNRRRDPSESASPRRLVTLTTGTDTMALELSVVPADTTPPRVTRAEARDSVEVHVFTDDPLEPEAPLDQVLVELFALPDTTLVPGGARLLWVRDHQAEQRARAEALRRDSAAADTAAGPPAGRGAGRGGRAVPADTALLPQREFVLVPARPLTPGARYLVRIDQLTNVSGIPGGGGSVDFEVPVPRAVPARRDTTALAAGAARRGSARPRLR